MNPLAPTDPLARALRRLVETETGFRLSTTQAKTERDSKNGHTDQDTHG